MITAYREPDRARGRQLMQRLIESVSHGVPAALHEVITLGRTLNKRAADVLAYFDRPGTSNGPTEAINGRLEHLRGSALGFRKPHQLHRPITPGDRRFQTPTTPPIVKSPLQPLGDLRVRQPAGEHREDLPLAL
jgi:Transposase